MPRALVVVGVILLVAVVVVAGSRHPQSHAKKILVEVETPDGVASGESVVEARPYGVPWWYPVGGNRGGGTAQRGEAASVDLGGGRHLFVTLNNQLHERPIVQLFQHVTADGRFDPAYIPMLVTFSNPEDANTVREVRPDDLAAAFGPGYRLRRLVALDTSESATRGNLARRFPALLEDLKRAPAARLDAQTFDTMRRGDIRTIGADAFEAADW